MKLPRRQFLHLAAGAAAPPTVSRIAQSHQLPWACIGWLPDAPCGFQPFCCASICRR
jgi:hypothetical protein